MDLVDDIHKIIYFGGFVFWIVKQLPLDDDRQDKLIKLLLKIQEQLPPSGQGLAVYEERYRGYSVDLWKDLPNWWTVWGWYELLAPLVPPIRERPNYKET
jgi:Protein of unknown function (DUF3632)